MANRSKLTIKSVSEALKINGGVIAHAARALNIDRRHVYTFIRNV
jgi:transcriptional regulator with GAF, ATPase, and Fis domain